MFGEVCLIYPAFMRSIAQVGADEFYKLLQHITIHPPALSQKLKGVSGYQFILGQSSDVEYAKTTREAISFFLHEECLILPDANILALGGAPGEGKFQIVTEEEFGLIQDIIRQQHWLESITVRKVEGALDKKAQEILDRIAHGKQTVAKLKKTQGDGLSLSDIVGSLTIAVPGLNMLNIWDLTYYAFYDQFHRFQQKEAYDANSRAALAGAKIPKEKLKSWVRPIEK